MRRLILSLPVRFFLLFLLSVTTPSDGIGSEIVISKEVSEGADFSSGDLSRFIFEVSPENLGTIAHNFSGETQVTLVFEWRAPSGKRFEVNLPSSYDPGVLFASYRVESDPVEDDILELAPLGELINLAGAEPDFVGFAVLPGAAETGIGVVGAFAIEPGQAIWFDAVRLTVSVPVSFENSIDATELRVDLTGEAFRNGNDPETWLRLIDQPEPVSKALDPLVDSMQKRLKRIERKIRKAKKRSALSRVARLNRVRARLIQRIRILSR